MRLWVTRTPPLRFFLVPEGETLPAGDVVVESTALQLASVELSAMSPWEVSVRRARKWFEANTSAIDAERAALSAGAQAVMASAAAAMSSFIESPELREILSAIGLDPARIVGDVSGTGEMVEELMALAEQADLSPDERARRVRKIIRQHGHLDANRALRRDPEAVARLLAALDAALSRAERA